MNDIKQIIVLRSDLKNKQGQKVRSGKLMAQVAHASMAFMSNRIRRYIYDAEIPIEEFSAPQLLWIEDLFTKVCLKVDSEEELLDIHQKAIEEGLEVHLITDSGLTEFDKPTNTCLAIGPDYSERIGKITGHLSLF